MNAVVPRASEPQAQYALGRQLKARLDLTGAELAYRSALELEPGFIDAWISLGILLKQQGHTADAEGCFRKAIAIAPEHHLGHLNLGNTLLLRGAVEEAVQVFRRAVELDATCAEAHNNLGHLLLAARLRAEAASHLSTALKLKPDYFEAAAGLGEAYVDDERYAQAIEPLSRAHALKPNHMEVRILLGRALGGVGEYPRAAEQFEAVWRRHPERRAAIYGLATSLAYSGQYTRPRKLLEQAIAAAPQDLHTEFAFATLLLRAGEFALGWKHYPARRAFESREPPAFSVPRWRGESLVGKTLFITREQGLGDEIMFASLFGELIHAARHCVIECDPRLARLYARSFPQATFIAVAPGTAPPDPPRFDCWAQLGDLAAYLRKDARDFPRHTGYLKADEARVDAWRERLEQRSGPEPMIGIGWRGGVARTRAAERSMTLDELQPLLGAPGAGRVSLQYGPCAGEVAEFRARSGVSLEHWQDAIDDIDEYAALISALDLTVSVCSSVVHLAGALGRPVWVMAPFVAEWRYGHEASNMIWYPSVRIFRQPRSGSWKPVITEVRRALRKNFESGNSRAPA